MFRILFLVLVFLIVAAAASVAFTPLGFIAERSGAGRLGVGWAQVSGTLLKGRIEGLHANGQPIGDVNLQLRPGSLLGLAPAFDVQWGGAGGSGAGIMALSPKSVTLSEFKLQQQIAAIEGLAQPVRAMGGVVRVQDGRLVMGPLGCIEAGGTMSTDAVRSMAAQYGRAFDDITGPIRCVDRALLIDLAGQSPAGDRVTVSGEARVGGASTFEVAIETQEAALAYALSQIGFELNDQTWRYRRETKGPALP